MSDFGCEFNVSKNTCKISKKSLIVDPDCVPSVTKTGRRSCKTTRRYKVSKETGCKYDSGKNRCAISKKSSIIDAQCVLSSTKSGRSSCKLHQSLKRKRSKKAPVAKIPQPIPLSPIATPKIHVEPSIRIPTPIPEPMPSPIVITRPTVESLFPTYIPAMLSFYRNNIAFPVNGKIIELPLITIQYAIRRVLPFIQTLTAGIQEHKSIAQMFESYPKALKDIERYIKNSQHDSAMISSVTNESTTSSLQGSIQRIPNGDEIRVFNTLVLNFVIDILNFAHDSASMNKRKSISEKDIDKAITVEPFFKAFTTSI